MDTKRSALVVLHGWGHDSTLWEAFRSQFPDRYVVLMDLPGFGKEPLVSSEWGVPEYAGWVKEKLEVVGGPYVLMGHSFGGRIAGVVASQNPSGLSGLILYGAPCLYRPTIFIRCIVAIAKVAKKLGFNRTKHLNSELVNADAQGLGDIFRRVVPFDETHILPKISVPTLLIWGEYDEEAPVPLAREMHSLIPKSSLAVLPRVGHNAHLENPTLFYGTVSRYLASL